MPDKAHKPAIALVTGAGAGIGRSCALALAQTGATVVATDIDPSACDETHKLIRQQGGTSVAHALDVADERAWEFVVEDVRTRQGPISVLVNNAALKASLVGDGGLLETEIAVWDRIMNVNLRGAMLGARRVLPGMLELGSGSIIMITSTGALRSVGGFATAYTSAKAGMNGLTRAIATTYGSRGVRCNAIAPGVIIVGGSEETQEIFRRSSQGLTQRPGRPSDIASMVVFLASEKGEFVNGQVLVVDGGLTSHMPGLSALSVGGRQMG